MESHTLTVAELPAHSHGRGTTEIQGWFTRIYTYTDQAKTSGCCNESHYDTAAGPSTGHQGTCAMAVGIKASDGWSGTSESIGSGTSINILNPYSVAYCFKRVL